MGPRYRAGMNKTVLITGCRSGFGKLAALECARRGHTVYAGLRDLSTAEALVAEAGDLPVIPVQLDVTSASDREAVVARMLQERGRIDALVNNAGVALGGYVEQVEEDEVRKVLEVNVIALLALTKAVLPAMREQRAGSIVMVGSVSGRVALPGLGIYAASKHALEGMSEALRHEVAPFGVLVTLVEPGPYKTDILGRNRTLGRNATAEGSPYAAYTAKAEQLFNKIAESGAGDPQDVAVKLADLAEARSAGFRHPMGTSARVRILMKDHGPFALLEWAIGRATRPD
jgi:NAD(P)-dependent dehydrogenase (short-subunit alcohol dehydrogenase family)